MVKFPIRRKLLILSSVIPTSTLFLYLVLATRLFEKDKIAYVFDSNLSFCRTVGTQLDSHLQSTATILDTLVKFYHADTRTLSQTGTAIFNGQNQLHSLTFYIENQGGSYSRSTQVAKSKTLLEQFSKRESQASHLDELERLKHSKDNVFLEIKPDGSTEFRKSK